jgi:hypothetical protein
MRAPRQVKPPRDIQIVTMPENVYSELAAQEAKKQAPYRFERSIRQFLMDALKGKASVLASNVRGASHRWPVDIAVYQLSQDFDTETPKAVVSCKYTSPYVKIRNTYDTNLARAYMELNDLHLKDASMKLFLVVNRPRKNSDVKRDYKTLFQNIGVRLVDYGEIADRKTLLDELTQMLRLS